MKPSLEARRAICTPRNARDALLELAAKTNRCHGTSTEFGISMNTFRYNNREGMGDGDRSVLALSQITSKQLTYEPDS
jgi:hypothetical protein